MIQTLCAIVVRAAGVEPAQAFRPYGFSYHYGFRRRRPGVCGLDYTFTVASAVGAARLVSTPSPIGAWLGIAMQKVSPNLSSSASRVSPRALNFIQVRCVYQFRHARAASL